MQITFIFTLAVLAASAAAEVAKVAEVAEDSKPCIVAGKEDEGSASCRDRFAWVLEHQDEDEWTRDKSPHDWDVVGLAQHINEECEGQCELDIEKVSTKRDFCNSK